MGTSRRQFIKVSALGVGGLVLAASSSSVLAGSLSSFFDPEDNYTGLNLKRYPTYCEVCFWKCAGWVYSDNEGNVKKVIGHPDDPHCNGRFCPRGTGGVGMYNDEDRLKMPLIRVTDEAGKQTYKEASWDEAFSVIAENMKKIRFRRKPWGPCRGRIPPGC